MTLFGDEILWQELGPATIETLLMTFFSTLVTVLIGLPLGVAVVASAPHGLAPHRTLNRVLGAIVNIGRSIPFIILAFLILPFTRFVVGTTIGWTGAVVPLTVAAIPFFARLVETSLLQVEPGKVEAARMMGATRTRIMFDVMVKEAAPSLVQQITVLVITLIGYGAMAGAIGAGGLGQLAMNHGYYRRNDAMILVTVVLIVIIVQLVQMLGDMLSRLVDHR